MQSHIAASRACRDWACRDPVLSISTTRTGRPSISSPAVMLSRELPNGSSPTTQILKSLGLVFPPGEMRMNLPKLSRYAAFTEYSDGFDWAGSRFEEDSSAKDISAMSGRLPSVRVKIGEIRPGRSRIRRVQIWRARAKRREKQGLETRWEKQGLWAGPFPRLTPWVSAALKACKPRSVNSSDLAEMADSDAGEIYC